MVKFLILAKLSPESARGVLKETPSGRENYLRQSYESIGARVLAFDWMWGLEYTVAITVEGPRDALLAMAANVAASGALGEVRSYELFSSAEMDRALTHKVAYRPPGA